MTNLSDKCREIWTEAYKLRDRYAGMEPDIGNFTALAKELALLSHDRFDDDPEAMDLLCVVYNALCRDAGVEGIQKSKFKKLAKLKSGDAVSG